MQGPGGNPVDKQLLFSTVDNAFWRRSKITHNITGSCKGMEGHKKGLPLQSVMESDLECTTSLHYLSPYRRR
jgi:uncharacterized protein YbcC (UPF0753/DUF2309 family)